MTTALLAGFECGHLGWSNHDLLISTRHLPHDRMAAHYRVAQSHVLARARDGLPWRHGLEARLRMADEARMDVTWDLSHFDRPGDPVAHARMAASTANASAPFWICPVNEPAMYPVLVGMPRHKAVEMAITITKVAKNHHPNVHVLTTDPINGVGERQFECTDALVATGLVDVVSVNYFPHTARTRLSKVLVKTARRYGLPIMVAETSWHDGHHEQERRYPGWNKGTWLRHVLDEVDIAKAKGAEWWASVGIQSSTARPGTPRGHGADGLTVSSVLTFPSIRTCRRRSDLSGTGLGSSPSSLRRPMGVRFMRSGNVCTHTAGGSSGGIPTALWIALISSALAAAPASI